MTRLQSKYLRSAFVILLVGFILLIVGVVELRDSPEDALHNSLFLASVVFNFIGAGVMGYAGRSKRLRAGG